MKTRQDILAEAITECLKECYRWSQPSANVDLKSIKNGKQYHPEPEGDPLCDRHYLSEENMRYIVNHYIDIYHIGSDWLEDIDLLLHYIQDPKSVKLSKESTKKFEPIKTIQKLTKSYPKIIELIEACRDFYRVDVEKNTFNMNTYLGPSPNSKKEDVEEYWRSRGWADFKIYDFYIEDILYPPFDEDEEDEPVTEEEFIEILNYYPLEIKIDYMIGKYWDKLKRVMKKLRSKIDFKYNIKRYWNKFKNSIQKWFTAKK